MGDEPGAKSCDVLMAVEGVRFRGGVDRNGMSGRQIGRWYCTRDTKEISGEPVLRRRETHLDARETPESEHEPPSNRERCLAGK
jgi:hypothetical protein